MHPYRYPAILTKEIEEDIKAEKRFWGGVVEFFVGIGIGIGIDILIVLFYQWAHLFLM